MHFQGLLVSVSDSRLSKGKLEGSWVRRLFSRWTFFSVVTPRKAPSEIWGARQTRVSIPAPVSSLSQLCGRRGAGFFPGHKRQPLEECLNVTKLSLML